MSRMTREQVKTVIHENIVSQLEMMGVEPTNRVLPNGDTRTEYSAHIKLGDSTIYVYYMTTPEQEAEMAECDDMSCIDWTAAIDGYEIR